METVCNHSKENFSLNIPLSNNPEKLSKSRINPLYVLDKIRIFQPINITQLKNKLNDIGYKISYGSLWEIVNKLEFCKLIKTRTEYDEKNKREKKIIYILEKKEDENDIDDSTN